jgi:hypothetical protein
MAGDEYYDDEDMPEEEALPPPVAGWTDALQAQFGSVPWWVISAVIHVVIMLLLSLIVVSTPPLEASETIIPMEVAETPPEELPPPDRRELFEREREIDMPDNLEHPVFVHEEVEVRDHMETENNMNNNTARGQEDAISDIPLGGTGVVGNLGVGGGGAGAYGFRGGGGRKRAALRGGGSRRSEAVVDAGLRWLSNNQEPDGSWAITKWGGSIDWGDVGVTGLALLAFLGAGHTEKTGKYKNNVIKAVNYLISKQNNQGAIGSGAGHWGYNHAIAGLSIAEAFGMARMQRTGVAAQKAVTWSIDQHQCSYSAWRYSPRQDPDTSVTGWFIMQLKSAKIAGLRVDGKGFQGAIAWLDKVTDMPAAGGGDKYNCGKARYRPESNPTASMTSVAMLGRQFMGWKRTDPLLVGGANYLVEHLPKWGQGGWMFYYWYYGTLVMFQMGGDWWKQWNASMRDMLISKQINAPGNIRLDGSWEPIQDGQRGGRAYSTAMACLCLEVYYRYLPLYKK